MHRVIDQGQIEIVYGKDRATGIFLSVHDKRLEYSSSAGDEANKISEMFGVKNGVGAYLNLYTGQSGIGFKVSISAMATFMSRYDVPAMDIEMLTGVEEDFDLCTDEEEWYEEEEQDVLKIEKKSKTQENLEPSQMQENVYCSACKMDEAKKICSRCKKVYYCNRECQSKDWPSHKLLCKAFKRDR